MTGERETAGSDFLSDLMSSLPPDAHRAAWEVIERHSGATIYINRQAVTRRRIEVAALLFAAGLSLGQVIERLLIRETLNKSHVVNMRMV